MTHVRRLTGCTLVVATLWGVQAGATDLTVFAAASLKTALEDVAADFEDATEHDVTLVFAGSSVLARQIQQGAPADIFISANVAWMDLLESDGRIARESRFDLVANSLVLIGTRDARPLEDITDLPKRLGEGRLAMALVDAVPAGIYGKAALDHFDLWNAVSAHVAQVDNVRAALTLVSLGEARFGIVYASDAVADTTVAVLAQFPSDSHPPIVYPAAAIAEHPLAPAFLDHLQSDTAKATFAAQGFLPVTP